jgi:uncharacterized protein (DUF983 family)
MDLKPCPRFIREKSNQRGLSCRECFENRNSSRYIRSCKCENLIHEDCLIEQICKNKRQIQDLSNFPDFWLSGYRRYQCPRCGEYVIFRRNFEIVNVDDEQLNDEVQEIKNRGTVRIIVLILLIILGIYILTLDIEPAPKIISEIVNMIFIIIDICCLLSKVNNVRFFLAIPRRIRSKKRKEEPMPS